MWLVDLWLFLIVCWVFALYVQVFAHNKQKVYTRREIRRWYGLLCSILLLMLAPAILRLLIVYTPSHHAHPPTLDNNLKQWGLVFKMYSNESPGELFPPLVQQDGLWVPDLYAIYPEYLTTTWLVCDPEDQTDAKRKMFEDSFYRDPLKGTVDLDKTAVLMAQNYVYIGWVVRNDSDVEVMKRYRAEKGVHIGDIESENTHLLWMREGVEDAFITDANDPQARALAQAKIPVMIARPRSNKYYDVVPVLFMDGHVEKIPLDTAPDHIKALTELFPEPRQ